MGVPLWGSPQIKITEFGGLCGPVPVKKDSSLRGLCWVAPFRETFGKPHVSLGGGLFSVRCQVTEAPPILSAAKLGFPEGAAANVL